jgi:hypothetical protein
MFPRLALMTLSATLALGLAAPAFASDAKSPERLELARNHAGESVRTVRFLRPIHSYEVIDNHAVLIWQTPTRAWLVDLQQGATCRDLDKSIAVGIDTMSDTINTSNGYIVGDFNLRCKITDIRKVDVAAMRAEQRGEVATVD